MTDDDIRRTAKFDQINAGHRDVLDQMRTFRDRLFTMTSENRQLTLDNLLPVERRLLQMAAEELGDNVLLAALGDDNV